MAEMHPTDQLTQLPPLGMDAESIQQDLQRYFNLSLGCDIECSRPHYLVQGLAWSVRDRLVERWKQTESSYRENDARFAYYLSMEFLLGRLLRNSVLNLGMDTATAQALEGLGLSLEQISDSEVEPGLGNGGLGRLAACFLDSCATLQLPVLGYGIRYDYGMFRQELHDCTQVEEPDHWLSDGFPWEIERPEYSQRIQFGGRTEHYEQNGQTWVRWIDTRDVLAVPWDVPVPGYRNETVNTLRLWSAAASHEFNLDDFNAGAYPEALAAKNAAENITMVLYPNDANENGKELRLRQQYFLASASLKDIVRRWRRDHGDSLEGFADKNFIQLNDTHPSLTVPELMRILMDEQGLDWDAAWGITSQTIGYTNHTLLPEALERWPVRLFRQWLPRLLEIVFEINHRFLEQVEAKWPGDTDRLRRMSLIEENGEPQVRMAFLALVASRSVNGVAGLHSDLLKQGLFRDFYELWPERFNNKTNGVTPRRWLLSCNPGLSRLISDTIGVNWTTDLDELKHLADHADDPAFQERWRAIKQENKARFIPRIKEDTGVTFMSEGLLDIQVKRIHEYKRQLLNVLHIVHLYDRLKRGDDADWTPRCVLFGGKAAPGYVMAKNIVKLICRVAQVVNDDPVTAGRLRVAFLANYQVSSMEWIAPAADLSEQLSTAGKEASGTGNMKFMMNGALTVGTLDGANIEIREAVGEGNFFLFGLTADAVQQRRADYDPNGIIEGDRDLRRVMDYFDQDAFSGSEPGVFDPIRDAIRSPDDPWLVAADFRSFVDTQHRAAELYRNHPAEWTRMSILNTAASGWFSSDRTIAEYNRDIWHLDPIPARRRGS